MLISKRDILCAFVKRHMFFDNGFVLIVFLYLQLATSDDYEVFRPQNDSEEN